MIDESILDEHGLLTHQEPIDDLRDKVMNSFAKLIFNERLIKRMVYRIKSLVDRIEESQRAITDLARIGNFSVDEICFFGRKAKKSDEEFTKYSEKLMSTQNSLSILSARLRMLNEKSDASN
jgi:hypothetical protein